MIIIKTLLQRSKSVYGEDEYPAFKAFYDRIAQSHRVDVILSKN